MFSRITPAVKTQASRWGLTLAVIFTAYYLIGYLVSLDLFVNTWAGILSMVVVVVFMAVAAIGARKDMGGYISFSNAFSASFLTGLISSLITTAVVIILFNLIDKEAAIQLQERGIETFIAMGEKLGMSQEQIDEQVIKMEQSNQYEAMAQVKAFFFGLVFYAILSAIIAAFVKKNEPIDA